MKRIIEAVKDESKSVQERVFILLGVLSLGAMLVMLALGLIADENPMSSLTVSLGFAVFLLLMLIGVRTKKFDVIAVVISVLMIFLLLPATFFFSGGINGGAPMWFVFCTLFISTIVSGRDRLIFLILNFISAGVCYIIAYETPGRVSVHNDKMAFIDSYLSMIFVGMMLSLMVGFEIKTLKNQKERSDEQSRRIEELGKAQNRFFSSMSHEIRTPINTIIGLNEMILREDISDEVAEDARNIQSASRILLSLINDILDMSKIRSEKMEIVPVIYDVGKMLSEIVNMISVMAEKKGLDFSIDVDPTMPSQLLSDEVRIKQILINLLNNAVKYTASGSVSLSVHCRRTGENRALVTYSVEDTGMGIRKESIPHLFDAFRRVDEEKNRYIEGTGLGLSIVKQLVDLLGGEISVNSIYRKGSTFVLTLEQETVDDKQIGTFSAKRFGGNDGRIRGGGSFEAPRARVLIVDDNKTNLLVTTKLLRRTKVITETALSGAECLKLTLQNHYDAIFMDHMMPVMDGIECLHEIRSQTGGLCRETPVIVLTANAGSDEQALYRREGFDAYLLKPIDTAALEETLIGLLPGELVKIEGMGITRYEQGREFVSVTKRKIPLLITTDSISDLPEDMPEKFDIPIIPYKICTNNGLFDDSFEMDGDVLVRCMSEEAFDILSAPPSVADYEEFFAEQLSRAQHILHISMAKRAGSAFANASEAALSFYNVSVVDSGHVSSGLGLSVMDTAEKMRREPFVKTEDLVTNIEAARTRIQSSFILRDTDYLYRSGRLSERMNKLCTAFMIHPVILMKNSAMAVGPIFLGSLKRARRAYIKRMLHHSGNIKTNVLFITYVGMRKEEIEEIRDIVAEYVKFDKVYLQKASPAVCANCGAGTFGLLFERK